MQRLTHSNLLSLINSSEPIVYKLEKRCAKFIWSCLNSHNCVMLPNMSAKSSRSSDFGDNYRYLNYKYNIEIHVWNLPLCKCINDLIYTCLTILQLIRIEFLYLSCVY